MGDAKKWKCTFFERRLLWVCGIREEGVPSALSQCPGLEIATLLIAQLTFYLSRLTLISSWFSSDGGKMEDEDTQLTVVPIKTRSHDQYIF